MIFRLALTSGLKPRLDDADLMSNARDSCAGKF